MKSIIVMALMIVIILATITILSLPTSVANFPDHGYVDFSTDRSTLFFRTGGGNNDVVFFDFFSPFDPTVKTKAYDPLSMYKLDDRYYLNDNGGLMISIEDLKKLYDPYFEYGIADDTLRIRYTLYDKLIQDSFGRRGTFIEYTKKVWDLEIDVRENSGTVDYTEYKPTTGGRNLPAIGDTAPNDDNSKSGTPVTLQNAIEKKGGNYYVPAEIMDAMGKQIFESKGYIHIQGENMGDVTAGVDRSHMNLDVELDPVFVPLESNTWHGGSVAPGDERYTWADYMNDVADGKRTTGWLWRAFYVPTGTFLDENGKEVALEADRIVPFNIYVPTTYDKDKTRLLYMLHGGTGNENTATGRLLLRHYGGMEIDRFAERYNYILVSPNGWTQNPMWRQGQALYSFFKASEMTLEEFPVDPEKLFITGNSMGGKGTIEITMRYPEMFRAMAPTAPKLADRDRDTGKTTINIEGTDYKLSDIEDMPSLVVLGAADSTTSFLTNIGNKEKKGVILAGIVPYLKNVTYIVVESGSHSYSYGSMLPAIFDFFESVLDPYDKKHDFTTLNIKAFSREAFLDDDAFTLAAATEVVGDTTMIALKDLEEIYGEEFKAYPVMVYNRNPEEVVNYWTIIYTHNSLNITLNEKNYRLNLERYKKDVFEELIKTGKDDLEFLDEAPEFTVAPYKKGGEIFVPALEVLRLLGVADVNIIKNPESNDLR